MKKSHIIITSLLFILGVLCFIFFDALQTKISNDVDINRMVRAILARSGLILLFGWLLFIYGGKKLFIFDKRFFTLFIWSLPCFMVAFVNFPYSVLANGTVTIFRTDLIWLYAIYTLCVAILEELIFRGILYLLAKDFLKNNRHAPLLTVIICAALFSLFHLTNMFGGDANVGYVMLQVVYTFLIGAMLTTTMLKLNNIWLCAVIHTIFNFGGHIIQFLGNNNSPWDQMFWILTITSGVLCAGHIIYSLIKLDKAYVSR